ncbi:hypothetical protein PACTADRAFT_47510 [Pachysolen tannophilus NRRL Y-2460]|uniref:FF domain-containing protein n=1 Tax=Pachysolen tannophilus NRRL Y-2460 TaxID=669874 RepID=A0A1E4U0T2_PACTA|nr:hypothetical protein PACTADRAFT_47510 [Pachysolen tannophilus NRRL Y-2460]
MTEETKSSWLEHGTGILDAYYDNIENVQLKSKMNNERPVVRSEKFRKRDGKFNQVNINDYGDPLYEIGLVNNWVMVITSRGGKFYHNKVTAVSKWVIYDEIEQDEELRAKIQDLDKADMLLLIAKARGLRLQVKDENYLSQKYLVKETETKPVAVAVSSSSSSSKCDESGIESGSDSKKNLKEEKFFTTEPLVLGYGSSSEEDSEEEEEKEEKEEEDSLEETADIDSDSVSSDNEGINFSDFETDIDSTSRDEFKSLLDDLGINPYSSFDLEIDKLIEQPRFLVVDNNKQRKAIFDEWCKEKLALTAAAAQSQAAPLEQHQEEDYNEFLANNPILQYIEYLNSKIPKLKKKLYYIEFRRKFKSEFSHIDLSDKEKENFYREYTILYYSCCGKNSGNSLNLNSKDLNKANLGAAQPTQNSTQLAPPQSVESAEHERTAHLTHSKKLSQSTVAPAPVLPVAPTTSTISAVSTVTEKLIQKYFPFTKEEIYHRLKTFHTQNPSH